MTDPIDKAEATLVKDEPVIAAHGALWVLSIVGEFLVGRTHLITAHEWGATQSTLVPVVTTALLGLSATAMRSFVSPAAAFAKRVEAEVQRRLSSTGFTVGGGGGGGGTRLPAPSFLGQGDIGTDKYPPGLAIGTVTVPAYGQGSVGSSGGLGGAAGIGYWLAPVSNTFLGPMLEGPTTDVEPTTDEAIAAANAIFPTS